MLIRKIFTWLCVCVCHSAVSKVWGHTHTPSWWMGWKEEEERRALYRCTDGGDINQRSILCSSRGLSCNSSTVPRRFVCIAYSMTDGSCCVKKQDPNTAFRHLGSSNAHIGSEAKIRQCEWLIANKRNTRNCKICHYRAYEARKLNWKI